MDWTKYSDNQKVNRIIPLFNKKRLLSQLNSSRFMQVLVIHYEQVKADPSGQIKRALDFLGVPSDWDRLECAEKHKNGYFRRKKVLMPHKLLYYP